MSRDKLSQSVAEFYAAQRAAPASAQRLLALASAARGRRRTTPAAWSVAAGLVLAVTAGLAYRAGRAHAPPPRTVVIQPSRTVSAPQTRETMQPRLILVRTHADWCPRCPSIAPIFADLTRKYANEPILFITLDITTPETRQQAWMMARSLGVFDLLGQHASNGRMSVEPGMIQLFDRESSAVLARLRSTDDQPEFEQTLAHALPTEGDAPKHP